MRVFCLLVLFFLSSAVLADKTSSVDSSESVLAESKAVDIPLVSETLEEAKESNTRNSAGVAPGKPSLSTLSNWPVVILALIGIVALILCLAWLARRFGGVNISGEKAMRVISTISLGTRERIVLVDVKGQQVLLGVTAHNINHLHTLGEHVLASPSERREAAIQQKSDREDTSDQARVKNDFSEKLQGLLKAARPASDDRV